MSRVFKFRAWQCVTKAMFYNIQQGTGDDVLNEHENVIYFGDNRVKPIGFMYPNSHPPFADYLENKNMIVMQFTGMLDKHGKEIYECDLIRAKLDGEVVIEKVYWEDGCPGFGPFYQYLGFPEDRWIDCASDIEVVGNIYEGVSYANPELLEEK